MFIYEILQKGTYMFKNEQSFTKLNNDTHSIAYQAFYVAIKKNEIITFTGNGYNSRSLCSAKYSNSKRRISYVFCHIV